MTLGAPAFPELPWAGDEIVEELALLAVLIVQASRTASARRPLTDCCCAVNTVRPSPSGGFSILCGAGAKK